MHVPGFAEVAQESGSDLLASLVTAGHRFPRIADELSRLESATDWAEAQSSGRIVPHPVRALQKHLTLSWRSLGRALKSERSVSNVVGATDLMVFEERRRNSCVAPSGRGR